MGSWRGGSTEEETPAQYMRDHDHDHDHAADANPPLSKVRM